MLTGSFMDTACRARPILPAIHVLEPPPGADNDQSARRQGQYPPARPENGRRAPGGDERYHGCAGTARDRRGDRHTHYTFQTRRAIAQAHDAQVPAGRLPKNGVRWPSMSENEALEASLREMP